MNSGPAFEWQATGCMYHKPSKPIQLKGKIEPSTTLSTTPSTLTPSIKLSKPFQPLLKVETPSTPTPRTTETKPGSFKVSTIKPSPTQRKMMRTNLKASSKPVQASSEPIPSFDAVYKDNDNWIISNATQPDVFKEMKAFTYPRTTEQQRQRPYCVFNPDTRIVSYHCQPMITKHRQIIPEYAYVCNLIRDRFGVDYFNRQPIIRTQCMQSTEEIQAYIREYPNC